MFFNKPYAGKKYSTSRRCIDSLKAKAMRNNRIFIPALALFFFAIIPAFGNTLCTICPNNKGANSLPAIQPLQTLLPTSVASLKGPSDVVLLNPEFSNAYLHPAEMLIGRVPGVWVTGGYNFYRIRIRGAVGPPLLVIDEMPFYNFNDEALNNLLWSIPTTDIARIEVLKSAAGASLYSQGGNGVIRVVTRSGKE